MIISKPTRNLPEKKSFCEIDDNDKRKDTLVSFLKERGLGEEEIDAIVHNLDKHSIKGLLDNG